MKLDPKIREKHMDDAQSKLAAEAAEYLDVPMIRRSVSEQTSKQKGFKKTVEKKVAHEAA